MTKVTEEVALATPLCLYQNNKLISSWQSFLETVKQRQKHIKVYLTVIAK